MHSGYHVQEETLAYLESAADDCLESFQEQFRETLAGKPLHDLDRFRRAQCFAKGPFVRQRFVHLRHPDDLRLNGDVIGLKHRRVAAPVHALVMTANHHDAAPNPGISLRMSRA